jgi:hypothetical protein
MRLRFDPDDLRDRHVELVQASVEAGPLSCATDQAGYFRPLLAGQRAQPQTGTDPYDRDHQITSVCGVLAPDISISPQSLPTATAVSPGAAAPGSASSSSASR